MSADSDGLQAKILFILLVAICTPEATKKLPLELGPTFIEGKKKTKSESTIFYSKIALLPTVALVLAFRSVLQGTPISF